MKIWLDDVREPPDDTWTWAKKSQEAISYLRFSPVPVTEVSLDYDLEGFDTGYPVARYLSTVVMREGEPKYIVRIHSMNPVGAERMEHELLHGFRAQQNIESVEVVSYDRLLIGRKNEPTRSAGNARGACPTAVATEPHED